MPGKPRTTLPAFAPVPRARDRHNGWKPEVQRAFIEALAETGSVKAAARRVGRAEVGAYLLRRHPEAREFRKAWDAALDIGMRRIEDLAMDRALNGVVEPVYSYGKLVGTRVRYRLLASSNAARLKPHGIFVKSKIEPEKWFLASQYDVRSSDALEDAATEFDIQGLELDWACVCWDANLRRHERKWEHYQFKGSAWQKVNDERRQAYLKNSYRVLLTRARQGMVVFVPNGSDSDPTRLPSWYDEIAAYLQKCGFNPL